MKIHPISPQFQTYENRTRQSFTPSFGVSEETKGKAEKKIRDVEFFGRKIVNKFSSFTRKKQIDAFYNELLDVDEKSPEYIKKLSKAGRVLAKNKEIEINFEDGRIAQIARSNEPHIFIMNHSNQANDPAMLAAFNTLLCDEYLKLGNGGICPRPKIILNEDILLSADEKTRFIFEKLGAIGIDASINSSNGTQNASKLVSLTRGLHNGEINVYIFPEGKLSAFGQMELKNKFQPGVSGIIYSLLKRNQKVHVIPLGFAYDKKNNPKLSSIHVGEPLIFEKDSEHVLVNKGSLDSDFTKESYKKFFGDANDEPRVITEQGEPVLGKSVLDYMSGIMAENLRVCTEEAKAKIPKKSFGKVGVYC